MGGYMLDVWGRRTNYLIGTGQACLLLIIQGAITLAIFDKGETNLAAGGAFVAFYLLQWFLWVTFFSPGTSSCYLTFIDRRHSPVFLSAAPGSARTLRGGAGRIRHG